MLTPILEPFVNPCQPMKERKGEFMRFLRLSITNITGLMNTFQGFIKNKTGGMVFLLHLV